MKYIDIQHSTTQKGMIEIRNGEATLEGAIDMMKACLPDVSPFHTDGSSLTIGLYSLQLRDGFGLTPFDAAFITNARRMIPELIQEIDKLKNKNVELENKLFKEAKT